MDEKTTGQLLNVLHNTHSPEDLQNYCQQHTLQRQQLSFAEAFSKLLDTYHLSKADVIRKSMMDRTYAYQVMSGVRIPGRDKVIALGIAAGASEKEIERLLACAMAGRLYPRSARDAILIYCIDHHYDILQTNEMLENAGEKLLF